MSKSKSFHRPYEKVMILKQKRIPRGSKAKGANPKRVTYGMVPFIAHSRSDEITEIKNRLVVARGQGCGCREGSDAA